MTRRAWRFVAAVGAGALLLAGWWVLWGPAIPRVAVAAPPEIDIDIDMPATRAQREAAIALATMPDDPWTLAQSLGASAPDKEACGLEDGPQFSKPGQQDEERVQTRAPTPRFLGAQARIDAALRTSADPLDRVAADLVNAGDMRTWAGIDAAVVQQAAISTDPRVVSLGHAVCMRAPALDGCAALTAARWAQADPGNGMPWVELLAQAQARGDGAGVQQAMASLAASTRFDTHLFAVPGAVIRALPENDGNLAADGDLVMRAVGRTDALQFPTFKPLLDACSNEAGGDAPRARQCVAVSDTMYAHSDTLIPYLISGNLLQRTTGDATRREATRAEYQVFTAHWSPATGLSPCGTIRDEMRKLRRYAEIGEVEAMREESRKFVPP